MAARDSMGAAAADVREKMRRAAALGENATATSIAMKFLGGTGGGEVPAGSDPVAAATEAVGADSSGEDGADEVAAHSVPLQRVRSRRGGISVDTSDHLAPEVKDACRQAIFVSIGPSKAKKMLRDWDHSVHTVGMAQKFIELHEAKLGMLGKIQVRPIHSLHASAPHNPCARLSPSSPSWPRGSMCARWQLMPFLLDCSLVFPAAAAVAPRAGGHGALAQHDQMAGRERRWPADHRQDHRGAGGGRRCGGAPGEAGRVRWLCRPLLHIYEYDCDLPYNNPELILN
eukprot:COSAG05_NODE_584_length_8527_cov_46.366279_5_plen_286_part_00